jgi:hypothetical protein
MIEWLINIALLLGALIASVIVIVALIVLDSLLTSEQAQYDRAAANMEFLGYSDWEIYCELGPRPKDKENKV